MSQKASGVVNIASAFANLAGRAAAQANANRRRVAETNIAAGTTQLQIALREERSRLSQAFSKHQGTLAVNAAFRGSSISDASPQAAVTTAALRAGNESAVAEANFFAQKAALIARNQTIDEDVTLASIEGGIRGLNIGLDLAAQLQELTEVRRETSFDLGGTGQTLRGTDIIRDIARTPGFEFTNVGNNFGFELGF